MVGGRATAPPGTLQGHSATVWGGTTELKGGGSPGSTGWKASSEPVLHGMTEQNDHWLLRKALGRAK